MFDLGMPTLIDTNGIDGCAVLCRRLGLQFIELNMNLPQYQINEIDIPHFKTVAEQNNIYYTIHLDENLNVSDFNPYVAEAYRRTVKEAIETAKLLNVPVINMHLPKGVYFTMPDKKVFLFGEYRDCYLKSIANFRDECEKSIGKSPIIICIENCNGYTNFQMDALKMLLQSPVFGLTFDVGHNYNTDGRDERFIADHSKRLRHMHLHDAIKNEKKDHLALGTGNINIQNYLTIANEHDCRVVLETKTVEGLEKSVMWMKYSGYISETENMLMSD